LPADFGLGNCEQRHGSSRSQAKAEAEQTPVGRAAAFNPESGK
jgi:hypothetical protein